jgi:hypothetical protein
VGASSADHIGYNMASSSRNADWLLQHISRDTVFLNLHNAITVMKNTAKDLDTILINITTAHYITTFGAKWAGPAKLQEWLIKNIEGRSQAPAQAARGGFLVRIGLA